MSGLCRTCSLVRAKFSRHCELLSTGVYEDAVGFSYDQGTVDLGTGVVSVDYQGRICTP